VLGKNVAQQAINPNLNFHVQALTLDEQIIDNFLELMDRFLIHFLKNQNFTVVKLVFYLLSSFLIIIQLIFALNNGFHPCQMVQSLLVISKLSVKLSQFQPQDWRIELLKAYCKMIETFLELILSEIGFTLK
jgi:hypothetical protein